MNLVTKGANYILHGEERGKGNAVGFHNLCVFKVSQCQEMRRENEGLKQELSKVQHGLANLRAEHGMAVEASAVERQLAAADVDRAKAAAQHLLELADRNAETAAIFEVCKNPFHHSSHQISTWFYKESSNTFYYFEWQSGVQMQ